MTQVFLGQDGDGRLAAVNLVAAGFAADAAFRDRFAREIAVARAVQGRWVATLLDGEAHVPALRGRVGAVHSRYDTRLADARRQVEIQLRVMRAITGSRVVRYA